MYVNKFQKSLCYAGFYANALLRQSTRNIERLTRPMPQESAAYLKECVERIKRVAFTLFASPLTVVGAAVGFGCHLLSACLGKGRFELIAPIKPPLRQERPASLFLLSNNACFQDPWSPLTGGMETALTENEEGETRLDEYVDVFDRRVDVYLGQEYETLSAQDAMIEKLRRLGFQWFIRDLGAHHPFFNPSGLFIASKYPLKDVEFASYPLKDRAGVAKGSAQGALSAKVYLASGKSLRLINTHLNYGEGAENQNARNRQLRNYAVPLLRRGPAVLAGDLNCNTAEINKRAAGLDRLTNAIEGQVSCTDEGKHRLRGKPRANCADCAERIDALIYDPRRVEVSEVEIRELRRNGRLLSDHFGIFARLQPK